MEMYIVFHGGRENCLMTNERRKGEKNNVILFEMTVTCANLKARNEHSKSFLSAFNKAPKILFNHEFLCFTPFYITAILKCKIPFYSSFIQYCLYQHNGALKYEWKTQTKPRKLCEATSLMHSVPAFLLIHLEVVFQFFNSFH